MDLIILLIIIFFVWRHFKKKKAAKQAKQKETSAAPVADFRLPPQKRQLRGQPVNEADVQALHSPKLWREGSDKGCLQNAKKYPQFKEENPDFSFLCTKALYNWALYNPHQETTAGPENIICELDRDTHAFDFLKYGVRLGKYYRDGYGCDRNPRQGAVVLFNVSKFVNRELALISQMAKKNEIKQYHLDDIREIERNIDDMSLYLGDCCALAWLGDWADNAYRYHFKLRPALQDRDVMQLEAASHALGNYKDYNTLEFPCPVRYNIAYEFALSLAGQNHPMGGHYLCIIQELSTLDHEHIGQSWEEDFKIFSQGDGAYATYRIGMQKLYGFGTAQDVIGGLDLLEKAYEKGSVSAALLLVEYYERLAANDALSSKQQDEARHLGGAWQDKQFKLRNDPSALLRAMSADSVAEAAKLFAAKYGSQITHGNEDYDEQDADDAAQGDTRVQDMPHFITDDLGREWVFDGAVGYGVRYRVHTEASWSAEMDANDSLYEGTVLIEQKNISGNTAKLFGRTFHW